MGSEMCIRDSLGRAQFPRVADGFLAVHILSPFLSFGRAKKETTTKMAIVLPQPGKKRLHGQQTVFKLQPVCKHVDPLLPHFDLSYHQAGRIARGNIFQFNERDPSCAQGAGWNYSQFFHKTLIVSSTLSTGGMVCYLQQGAHQSGVNYLPAIRCLMPRRTLRISRQPAQCQ